MRGKLEYICVFHNFLKTFDLSSNSIKQGWRPPSPPPFFFFLVAKKKKRKGNKEKKKGLQSRTYLKAVTKVKMLLL